MISIDDRKITPMLRQYQEAKSECPEGALLLFRMGDFYELFFDDAVIASRELELTLTTRDKSENPIPMAGVPHHAVASYIARLLDKGISVAICDQVEDPKKAKGLVKREVTRIITPGTVSDLEALNPAAKQYLACVLEMPTQGTFVAAFLDMLAGEVLCTTVLEADVCDELLRMHVREVLLSPACMPLFRDILSRARMNVRPCSQAFLQETQGAQTERFVSYFGDSTYQEWQRAHGARAILGVCGVLHFAESTQKRTLHALAQPVFYARQDFVLMDEATRRNLELTHTSYSTERTGSLLWHLDRCKTAMGSRLLAQWLLFPLRDGALIQARLDNVEALHNNRALRVSLQCALAAVRDVERLIGKVALQKATPRDLGALKTSLQALPCVQELFLQESSPLAVRWQQADMLAPVTTLLAEALCDELPLQKNEGGIFRVGYREDLDGWIKLSTEGFDIIADLERRERERTGIANLKVRYNKIFGYYIEISNSNLKLVPKDYVRKQTLVNAERFITDELKKFEDKVLHADDARKAREQELFDELVADLCKHVLLLRALSRLIAETDVLVSLADVAEAYRYTRPTWVKEPVLHLTQARHPVVERLLPAGDSFVPNDMHVDTAHARLLMLTGPNMAGKSTVMRQAAVCSILAHVGSFVPAEHAVVGLCDRIFTRVGAHDHLGRGQSTFMVEMLETAHILRQATQHSLVVIDEIGRGTSTFDGISIAWSVAEYLHDVVQCRAMFATHYHELIALSLSKPCVVNMSMAVLEEAGKVVFLRTMVPGGASRSYGIAVAELAGLPESVLLRARDMLKHLEQSNMHLNAPIEEVVRTREHVHVRNKKIQPSAQMSLF